MTERETRLRLLAEKAALLPPAPGVYLLSGSDGTVLYVGKAVDLRARVRGYFQGADTRPRIGLLLRDVHDLAFIVTASEQEALILENTLIKEHQPRCNVLLKDDKSFWSLVLDRTHAFPALRRVRSHELAPATASVGCSYFGPYASGRALKETLAGLQRLVPLRTCKDGEFSRRSRPCLQHQLGLCLAPCCGLIDAAAYAALVDRAVLFLRGRGGELAGLLEAEMQAAADDLAFEKAAGLRDRLAFLETTLRKQAVFTHRGRDLDVTGYVREGDLHLFCFLCYREGRLAEKQVLRVKSAVLEQDEVIESVLYQFYQRRELPARLLVPDGFPPLETLAAALGQRSAIAIVRPSRGQLAAMLAMADRNALEELRSRDPAAPEIALERLARALHLPGPLRRIEGFDVSNLGGTDFVASRVTFLDGKPAPEEYRHYAITESGEPNDVAMLASVVRRRLVRGVAEGELPDLLLLDGGRGHLSAVVALVRELGLEQRFGLAALAKDRGPGTGERLFLPGRKNPLRLRVGSPELALVVRCRDEAHRFALAYQRKRRGKRSLHSILDEVPGIGPTLRKRILEAFPELASLRNPSDLAAIRGLSRKTAAAVIEFLSRFQAPEPGG